MSKQKLVEPLPGPDETEPLKKDNVVLEQKLSSIEPWTDQELYGTLTEFLKKHVYFSRENLYHALACSILAAKRIDQFSTTGYLLFFGSPETGKSRGLDVIAALSNALQCASVSSSALFHAVNTGKFEWVLIDEYDLISDEMREATNQILNCGYRKGKQAIRMGGQNKDKLNYFDCYGPKAIATIRQPPDTLMSRSILFQMTQAPPGSVEFTIDTLKAREIKTQLALYAERYANRKVMREFNPQEWGSNRLAEIFYGLFQVTPNLETEEQLRSLCRDMIEERHNMDSTETWEALIVDAIVELNGLQRTLGSSEIVEVNAKDLLPYVVSRIESEPAKKRWNSKRLAQNLRRIGFIQHHTRGGNVWELGLKQWQILLTRFRQGELSEPSECKTGGTP